MRWCLPVCLFVRSNGFLAHLQFAAFYVLAFLVCLNMVCAAPRAMLAASAWRWACRAFVPARSSVCACMLRLCVEHAQA
jgi:hypothetical protein